MKPTGARGWVVLLLLLWLMTVPAGYAAEAQSEGQPSDETPSKVNEKATTLDELVVTGTKTPHTLKDVPVETIVINAADIQKTNAQNVMGVLKQIPGLSTANHDDVFGTYTWRATLQGLPFDSGYGLVLIDGQRAMGCGQSGGMGEYGIGLNQIPLSMIERIEVVKGPGSALYGSDAVTGVINVITRKIPGEPVGWAGVGYGWYDVKRQLSDGKDEQAAGDRNVHQAYSGYSDRIGDSAGYLLAYHFEGADDIAAAPLASQRHSMMGKIDARAGERVKLSGKLELSDYRKTDNRDEDSLRVSLGAEWQAAQGHLLSLKGYTYTWDFMHGSHGDPYGYKNGYMGFNQAELQDTWTITRNNTLSLGGELQEQRIDYGIENQDGSLISVDESVKTSSLFAQDELVLWEKVTLVGGVRYDDHSVFGTEINPKFSTMIRLAEATTLRASIGRSFKSPTIRQLYYDAPYRHGTFYAQSNRDLKPEKALGYTLGLEQRLKADRIQLNLGYFHNDVDDLVVRVDTGSLYNGLPLMVYENVEKAWTQGLEFMGRAKFGASFEVALAYTYTQTKNEASGKELTYVPDHSVSLRPSYEWESLKLGVSAGMTYTGRQYTDTGNTAQIDSQTVVDAKIYKYLSSYCKLSFEADDIFDSKENAVNSYDAGRTLLAKLDLEF